MGHVLCRSNHFLPKAPKIFINSQSNVVCIACSYHFMTTYWIHLTGFAANTYFSHSGGVDYHYQCMPLHPDYNSFSNSGYWSVISGVEFETGNAGLFSGSPQGQNVPCARWLIPRSAIMMSPAKRNCPHGWNKEYEGNISLNQSTLANIAILFSRYIC